MSYGAESLIITGIELDYYKFINPNKNEFTFLNNGIKNCLKDYFGPEIESQFKI